MSEAWAIAIVTIVSGAVIAVIGLGVKALWIIAKTLKEFVMKKDCENAMGEHCNEIKLLRAGFANNKAALRQIILTLKREHGIDIHYEE